MYPRYTTIQGAKGAQPTRPRQIGSVHQQHLAIFLGFISNPFFSLKAD